VDRRRSVRGSLRCEISFWLRSAWGQTELRKLWSMSAFAAADISSCALTTEKCQFQTFKDWNVSRRYAHPFRQFCIKVWQQHDAILIATG
jgi:hypothetical protein